MIPAFLFIIVNFSYTENKTQTLVLFDRNYSISYFKIDDVFVEDYHEEDRVFWDTIFSDAYPEKNLHDLEDPLKNYREIDISRYKDVLKQLTLYSICVYKGKQILCFYNQTGKTFQLSNQGNLNHETNEQSSVSNIFTIKPDEIFYLINDCDYKQFYGREGEGRYFVTYRISDILPDGQKRVPFFRFETYVWKNVKIPIEISIYGFFRTYVSGKSPYLTVEKKHLKVNGERYYSFAINPMEYNKMYSFALKESDNFILGIDPQLKKLSPDKFVVQGPSLTAKTGVENLSDGIIQYDNKWVSGGKLPIQLEYNFKSEQSIAGVRISLTKYGYWGSFPLHNLLVGKFSLELYNKTNGLITSVNFIPEEPLIYLQFRNHMTVKRVVFVFPTDSAQNNIRIHEIEWYSSTGPTPIMWEAVKKGDVDSLTNAFYPGVNINATDSQGLTLLHYSLLSNRFDIAEILIKKGADVNQGNGYRSGEFLIHHMLRLNKIEAVKFLVENGANLNVTNYENHTPVFLSISCSNSEIFFYLTDKMQDKLVERELSEMLNIAVRQGKLDICRYLLDKQKMKLGTNQNFLILAVESGNNDLVSYLIDRGFPINLSDRYGNPLTYAIRNRRLDIVELLIQKGAEVNLHIPENGFTPLHFACESGSLEIVKFLVDHKADVFAKDNKGIYPIMYSKNLKIRNYLKSLMNKKSKK